MTNKLIVAKFGGSSMRDAEAMRRSAKVGFNHHASLIIVSATYGTTNLLEKLASLAESSDWQECEEVLNELNNKHYAIAEELNLPQEGIEEIKKILGEQKTLAKGINLLKECSPKAMDSLYSTGERLSSQLFSYACREVFEINGSAKEIKWLDARKIIKTDDTFSKANPNIEKIKEMSKAHLGLINNENHIYVTQGFIGSTEEGFTTTLGRGGSDYSAALFAEGIGADVLQIWTDVPGIATTDPRICSDAKSIEEITFQEASELATFGAKILHPTTLAPAMRVDIPVFVGSSYEAEKKGTWIKRSIDKLPLVRAMAIRKKQGIMTITTPKMINAYGFLGKVFDIFEKHKVSVDAVTTSEISLALTVDEGVLKNRNLLSDLSLLADVKVEEKLSLVSLIGNNINHTPGLGQKIFSSLENINVRMICHGASKHNFCFLVNEADGEQAVKVLHRAFIN